MSAEHDLGEECSGSSVKWTVRNKLKQFAASAGQYFIWNVPGGRGEPEKVLPGRTLIFSLHAPAAERVSLAGDFNAWDPDVHPLEKSSDGEWVRTVCLPPGRYEYKFVVDGHWQDDPACTAHAPNPFGGENCVVILS